MTFFWLKVCSTFEMWTQSCNLYGRNCFILIRSLSFHEYLINDVPIWKCRNTKQLLRQHNVAKNFMKSNQISELLLYNLRLQTKVKYSKVHYKAIPTLLMFCLLNPQTNACEPNPNTTSSDFNWWKSVTKIFCFHAISTDICLLF